MNNLQGNIMEVKRIAMSGLNVEIVRDGEKFEMELMARDYNTVKMPISIEVAKSFKFMMESERNDA